MNPKNKAIKINLYIVISLILFSGFMFLVFNRFTIAFKSVERVLIENKHSTQTQKSFNLENLKELKTKMPLES